MGKILAEEPCGIQEHGSWKLNSQEGTLSDHVAFHSRWEGNPHGSGGEGHQGGVTLTKAEGTASARFWRLEEGSSSIGRFLNLELDRRVHTPVSS